MTYDSPVGISAANIYMYTDGYYRARGFRLLNVNTNKQINVFFLQDGVDSYMKITMNKKK